MLNTIRTTFKFCTSVIRRFWPIKSKDDSVENVLNYKFYNDTLASSGQPTKRQLSAIQEAGYAVVINLAPYDILENYLEGEEKIVVDLGMKYFHIPVDFLHPQNVDFSRFVEIMQQKPDEKIWVHCAANMRASAFVFKYRSSILGEDEKTAIWDLREIWEPFGVWKKFVCNIKAKES